MKAGLGTLPPARILIAMVWLAAIVIVCAAAPLIAPQDPNANHLTRMFLAPGVEGNLLGTDELGRDVLSRVIHGGRTAMSVALLSALIAAVIGTISGAAAGYIGSTLDQVLMRLSEIQVSVPAIFMAVLVISFGTRGTGGLVAVLTMAAWPSFFRLARAGAIVVRTAPYVEAATLMGSGNLSIVFRHMLPAVAPVVIVTTTLEFSQGLLLVATLSFLGLGVPPPTPDWGTMVSSGQTLLPVAWWISGVPGIVIISIVLAANTVGDWLAERLHLGEAAA
jgi:peptide/nickel transport system permease protein